MIGRSKQKSWWSISRPDPYPEIGFERTLGRVILETIDSSFNAIALQDQSKEVFTATFSKGRRVASITAASDERIFLSTFSCNGVTLAHLNTPDLQEAARAVDLWLIHQMALRDLKESLSNFEVSDMAFEIEAGRGVTAQWEFLLSPAPWLRPECVALLRAASHRPSLRQLFPVVSLGSRVSFSRTIGYPFSIVGGCAVWTETEYRALAPDHTLLGEGSIEEVLDVLEQILPPSIGPAIYGTADDVIAG